MAIFKAFTSMGVIALLSFALSGCVSESYSYDGYRDYGPAYGGFYSGPEVIYRSGPRYNSRYYRDNRYYRDRSYRDRAYRERNRPRPEGRADYNRPINRSDKRLIVVPTNNQPNGSAENQGRMRLFKRESHN
ncbi:hypothetical protein QBD00_002348 [Ochrobactrum sp. AN78]|nr:hypothetical protein [Ochrobactrum sp. AN78]